MADALLLLHSTVRDDQLDQEIEDNSVLMPIGGTSQYKDVAPETVI